MSTVGPWPRLEEMAEMIFFDLRGISSRSRGWL